MVSLVEGDNAVLNKASGGGRDDESTLTLAASSFLKSAEHASARDCVVKHPAWPESRPHKTSAVAESFVRSRVWAAIEILVNTTGIGIENAVDVFIKPQRQVITKGSFSRGELILIPEPTAIKILDAKALAPGDPAPSGFAEVYVHDPPSGFASRTFLAMAGSEIACPYWYVEQSPCPDGANMKTVWFRMGVIGGADPVCEATLASALSPPDAEPTPASAASFFSCRRRVRVGKSG